MKVQPYVFFDGKCEEALEFYKSEIGAKVKALMRFEEAPDQSKMKPEARTRSCTPIQGREPKSWPPTAIAWARRSSRASR